MDRLKAEESAADHRARAAGVCRATQVASATLLHTLHAGLRMHSASDDTRT